MQCNLIGKARMAPYIPFLQTLPPHRVRAYTLCRNNVLSAVSGKYQSLSHSRAFAHAIHLPGTPPPHSPLIKPAHFLSLSITTACYMKLALHHAHKAKLATAFSVLPLHFVYIYNTTSHIVLWWSIHTHHTHTFFLRPRAPTWGERGRQREKKRAIHILSSLIGNSHVPWRQKLGPLHFI